MLDVTFSVIIPTTGRDSLEATLQSCKQLGPNDQIIVVSDDGPMLNLWKAFEKTYEADLLCPTIFLFPRPADHCWGMGLRNLAMKSAEGSHLLFLDDDDCFAAHSLEMVRKVCADYPLHLCLFGVRENGRVFPTKPELTDGNIRSSCGAVPNIPKRLGTWGKRLGGEFDFYSSCRFNHLWKREIVIANARPHEKAKSPFATKGI